MARAVKSRRTERHRKSKIQAEMPFNRTNYMIVIAGAALIIATYVLLATNDSVYGFIPLDLVPVLLFIGYLVIIPIGIMYRGKKKAGETSKTPTEPAK